jgi:hypothetical protein
MRQYVEKSCSCHNTGDTMLKLALDSLNTKVVMRMLLLAVMLFLSELCINYTDHGQVVLNILMVIKICSSNMEPF